MDFSGFKAVAVSNQRRPGGLPPKVQEFDDMKYRKATTKSGVVGQFYISGARIKELNLTTNALRHFKSPDPNVVLIGVVEDKHAKMLRAREGKKKGNHFKSDALEVALNVAGTIDSNSTENQFLKLTKVGENVEIDGVPVIAAFTISKGQKKAASAKAKAETKVETAEVNVKEEATSINPTPATVEAPQVEASAPTAPEVPQSPASTADTDWQ
jgi:hypothetical protein